MLYLKHQTVKRKTKKATKNFFETILLFIYHFLYTTYHDVFGIVHRKKCDKKSFNIDINLTLFSRAIEYWIGLLGVTIIIGLFQKTLLKFNSSDEEKFVLGTGRFTQKNKSPAAEWKQVLFWRGGNFMNTFYTGTEFYQVYLFKIRIALQFTGRTTYISRCIKYKGKTRFCH